jgi:two-component Ni(II)/redox sensor kinase NrsS
MAGLSLLVMGTLLYAAGFAMSRLLLKTQEAAIQRELQTLAGTLHDSLKPALPQVARPSTSLVALLPGLCVVGEPCLPPKDLFHRHAISASDPDRYKLRVFNHYWRLIATSPGAQSVQLKRGALGWKLTVNGTGDRLGTYAIHLHHSNGPDEPIWGYLQISRSLADVDAEAERLWWLGHVVFAVAMVGMALASWWLAGLAMAPLLEAYRRQQQFSADVAHELRTPLANLLAVVEAERGSIAEAPHFMTANSLDRVLRQGRRLEGLISDLLLLASLERPCPQNQKQICDLADITADVLDDFGEAAAAAGVMLERDQWVTAARVVGTESELSRLVINLFSNAIQHSPVGGRIGVALEQLGREIRLSVRDCGPGIAAAEREQLFDRFTRVDPARSRAQGGTGLGLAIAQAIARRHGGEITVQSALLEGSCFCVLLPVAD